MSPQTNPRAIALRVLERIEDDGAYANLVLASVLGRVELDRRDRALVTALVDGTTRMRRACDFLVDRFLKGDVEPDVRRALRLGAFQLVFMETPAHAAVSATVSVAPRRVRGLVNAVLRRVSENLLSPADPKQWPNEQTRLSYPDWIVERLSNDLGTRTAIETLEIMNIPAAPHVRDDGYTQDAASQAVVDALAAQPGERILDMCAAPGGKATALCSTGAQVFAGDYTTNRTSLIAANARALQDQNRISVFVADGTAPPFRSETFDAVLLDAPCSGLGSLRRRADARWRITEPDVANLATLQLQLLRAAAKLVRPNGRLIYSVCTLLDAETRDVDAQFQVGEPRFSHEALGNPWQSTAIGGGQLLPSRTGHDGMTCIRYRRK